MFVQFEIATASGRVLGPFSARELREQVRKQNDSQDEERIEGWDARVVGCDETPQ